MVEKFVIDASVGAKWFFKEESQDLSLNFYHRLRVKEIGLIVPDLFYVEMSNICWQRCRRRMINHNQADSILEEIMSVPFEGYSDKEFADVAFENAVRFGISVYDGVYIALAEACVVPLVTADEKLLKATKGSFDFILPLREH